MSDDRELSGPVDFMDKVMAQAKQWRVSFDEIEAVRQEIKIQASWILVQSSVRDVYAELLRPWLECEARLLLAIKARGLRPSASAYARWRRRHAKNVRQVGAVK